MTQKITPEDAAKLTYEDVVALEQETAQREKSHKKFRWALGIVGAALLVGAAITIGPVGLAAFSTAWWAVNGPLTSLGLVGVGSAIVARVLDRKNIANLKVLRAEKLLREGQLDQRTQEDVQQKFNKSFNKGAKHIREPIQDILRKARPELNDTQTVARQPQGSESNAHPENEKSL